MHPLPISLLTVPHIYLATTCGIICNQYQLVVYYNLQFDLFLAVLEFIVAQSPYGMRGMLIGAFYCVRGVFGFFTALLFLFFTLGFKAHPLELPVGSVFSCGMPLNATVIVMSVVGLGLYIVVARKYKQRVRDDHFNPRIFAEKYYYGSTLRPRSVSTSTYYTSTIK